VGVGAGADPQSAHVIIRRMAAGQFIKKRSDWWSSPGWLAWLGSGLARVWASPWSALGVLLAGVMRLGGARWQWRHGVLEASGGAMATWLARRGGPQALTLGHVVLAVDEPSLNHWRAHERVHVQQYERWGVLMVPAYLAESAWQRCRGRCAYHDNRFERQARQWGGPSP
jgi:hypothetical protein